MTVSVFERVLAILPSASSMEKHRLKVLAIVGIRSSSQVQSGFRVKMASLRRGWDFLTSSRSLSLFQSSLVDIRSSPSSWAIENLQHGTLRYNILDHGTTLAKRGAVGFSGEIIEMIVVEAFLISFSCEEEENVIDRLPRMDHSAKTAVMWYTRLHLILILSVMMWGGRVKEGFFPRGKDMTHFCMFGLEGLRRLGVKGVLEMFGRVWDVTWAKDVDLPLPLRLEAVVHPSSLGGP